MDDKSSSKSYRHGSVDKGTARLQNDEPDGGRRSLGNVLYPQRASVGAAVSHKASSRPSGASDQLLSVRGSPFTRRKYSTDMSAESSPTLGRRRASSGLLGRLIQALEHGSDDEQLAPEELRRRVFRDCDVEVSVDDEDLVLVDGGVVSERTRESPKFCLLVFVLEDWLSEVLSVRRVVVRSIFKDLSDGLVLTELMEILTGQTAPGISGIQATSAGKMQRLRQTLKWIDEELALVRTNDGRDLWTMELVWERDAIATLHLLVALARHYGCPQALPPDVSVEIVNMSDESSENAFSSQLVEITGAQVKETGSTLVLSDKGDVFDKFFRQVPRKVKAAQDVLMKFANDHLRQLDFHQPNDDFAEAFTDGVRLIYLLAVLGKYFVCLSHFQRNPRNHSEKIANVKTVFQLMRDAGLKPKGSPTDVVEGDIKATMRILYEIFHKYK